MKLLDPDVLDDEAYWTDDEPDTTPRRADGRRASPGQIWWLQNNRREILRQGYAQGKLLKDIAAELGEGVTKAKVAGEAYRLGLKHPHADYSQRMDHWTPPKKHKPRK